MARRQGQNVRPAQNYLSSPNRQPRTASTCLNQGQFWENDEKCLSTIACTFPATKFEAFVFVYKNKSAKQLEQLADTMNKKYTHSEFLWSHPAEGGDSTLVPCIIQQDRDKLKTLRENLGYVEEN